MSASNSPVEPLMFCPDCLDFFQESQAYSLDEEMHLLPEPRCRLCHEKAVSRSTRVSQRKDPYFLNYQEMIPKGRNRIPKSERETKLPKPSNGFT